MQSPLQWRDLLRLSLLSLAFSFCAKPASDLQTDSLQEKLVDLTELGYKQITEIDLPASARTDGGPQQELGPDCQEYPYFDGKYRMSFKVTTTEANAPEQFQSVIILVAPSGLVFPYIAAVPITLVKNQYVTVEVPVAPGNNLGWTVGMINTTNYYWTVYKCTYGFNFPSPYFFLTPDNYDDGSWTAQKVPWASHKHPFIAQCLGEPNIYVTKPWCTAEWTSTVTKNSNANPNGWWGMYDMVDPGNCGTTTSYFQHTVQGNQPPGVYTLSGLSYPLVVNGTIPGLSQPNVRPIVNSSDYPGYSSWQISVQIGSLSHQFNNPQTTAVYLNNGSCNYSVQ